MNGLHILVVPTKEIHREKNGEERWCFTCRGRRDFEYVVERPVEEMSYYGPNYRIECATCRTADGDLFPGRYREGED